MNNDPLARSDGVPPRVVEDWTKVSGHQVSRAGRPAFCSCGEQQPRDSSSSGTHWRREHLALVWPELVPKLRGESTADWMARVSDELVKATAAEQELYEALGLGRPTGKGETYPLLTDEYMAASDRVEVLEHQAHEVRDRVLLLFGDEPSGDPSKEAPNL